MYLETIASATSLPVSLAEAKLHLRVDISEDNSLIERMLRAATTACEHHAHRAFVTQALRLSLTDWLDEIALWHVPVQSVTSVTYVTLDGVTETLSPSAWHFEGGSVWVTHRPIAALRGGLPVRVDYVAGYGTAAQVPDVYKSAILLLVGHYYENREAVVVGQGYSSMVLPLAVKSLLEIDRGGW